MEYLDIVDENGVPTGQIVERGKAHEEGVRHRTSHVWLVRKRNGKLEVLLQKRSDNKDSFPGCYDISSAGHIPAGVDFRPSAIRELREELGIEAREEELIYCGDHRISRDDIFHGKLFRNRQFSRVFALWCDLEISDFRLQEEEVAEVRWMDLGELMAAVDDDRIPHCILPGELQMVKDGIE